MVAGTSPSFVSVRANFANRCNANATAEGWTFNDGDEEFRQFVEQTQHHGKAGRFKNPCRAAGIELFLHPGKIATSAETLANS
jgi:hypothetical protein